ncbi:MAG TPA: serine/threonine-protein kinase [Thermoanaerobaculia bacterium]|nr:serine/threonine-protein kinase [Thermoanaerobaculia bacterium]
MTPPKLGRYEIVDEIGKGAMGVVYLARDPLIGRLVALKTFRIGYSVKDHEMEQFRVRFMREAQSAGILSHPNIVTIHDVVEQTEEGMAFIAMEYVRGTTLKAMLQSDQVLSLGFVVDIIGQVAEALDYAHAHRVIHRDVKPANILITADNRVKITDFGIARLDTSNLTQEGQLLGTPNYMAPEQIQGKEVDHRADLFALGVVLYEMLTRHKPFQGENLTVVSHRIVYDQFTPPRDYARDMPPGLEPILDRALEKDPARRYQRAKDLAEDLRRVLTGSRDDLNETLSIASWAPSTGPGMPPPPPAPPGGGTTTAASPNGAAVRPAAPVQAPSRGKTPKAPLSLKKVGLYALLGAIVVVLGVAAMKLGTSWSRPDQTAAAVTPPAQAQLERFNGLLQEGETRLKELNYAGAMQSLSRALEIAPNEQEKARVTRRLQEIGLQYNDYVQTLSRSGQIAAYLESAKEAFGDERYADAMKSADSVLAIDASNAEANQIRSDSEKSLARLRQARPRTTPTPTPTRPQVAGVTPPPEPSPTPEPQAPSTENLPSRLRIAITSELPMVTVIVDGEKNKRFVSQPFRGERGGILRRAKGFNTSRIFEVPAGNTELRALVVPDGKPGRSKAFSLPGGGFRTLEIRVSQSGDVEFAVN